MVPQRTTRRGLLAAAGSAIAAGVAGCSTSAPRNPTATARGGTGGGSDGVDERSTVAGSAYTDVYRSVVDSVAAVRVRTAGGTSQGTAWTYDDRHLLTNQHVVAGAESVSLWLDGGWRSATVVGTDVYSDLAALRLRNPPGSVPALPLVETEPPVGTRVLAIGNPFGYSGSVSAGIISGVDRTLPAPNGFSIADAVQTDAAVNPGNSGGPLVTLDGEVVGVVNAGGGDNIGFAISAAMVRQVVPELVGDGFYGHSYMGIGLRDVTPPVVAANGLRISHGVYVDEVVPDSPADGVLQGSTGTRRLDGGSVPVGGDVIVRLDDTPIPTRQALSTFLALETSPDDTIAVTLLRDGDRTTVDLTLGQRPPP